jgi:hypothetical protein
MENNQVSAETSRANLVWWSLFGALGAFAYIAFTSYLPQGGISLHNGVASKGLITLYAISAIVSGVLILGRPIWLYRNGHWKEAVLQFCYTIVGLIFLMIFAIADVFPFI